MTSSGLQHATFRIIAQYLNNYYILRKLKKFNDLIRTGTRGHPACSIMPQPSTVQHTEHTNNKGARIIIKKLKT
jgi:hypothetical protein